MTRSNGRARGVREGLQRKKVEQQGRQPFRVYHVVHVESGGSPVHIPCPKYHVEGR